MIVDREGRARRAIVGRIKIELRPFVLVVCEQDGNSFKSIVQNAETVRYVTRDGSKSVTEISKGDKLLLWVVEGGRHFGTLVEEETVIEY